MNDHTKISLYLLVFIVIILLKIQYGTDSFDKMILYRALNTRIPKELSFSTDNIIYDYAGQIGLTVSYVWNLLMHTKHALAISTHGVPYNLINVLDKLKHQEIVNLNDKVLWYHVFKNNKIPHPNIISYTDSVGTIQYLNKSNSKELLSKPRFGGLGKGISVIKNSPFVPYAKPNMIIQERIHMCNNSNAKDYRLTTLYTGELFHLLELKSVSSTVSTNGLTVATNCKRIQCDHLSNEENKSIQTISNQLGLLHKTFYKDVFSIGWDIVIECNNKSHMAYVLEGNVGHSIWNRFNVDVKLIDKYIDKCKIFYKKIGYDF